MNRRDIVKQILYEASASSMEEAQGLLEAMIAEGMVSASGLDEEFTPTEADRLLSEFRKELPGIRRWLCEAGLLETFGHG